MENMKNFIGVNILFFQSMNGMGWFLFLIVFLVLLNLMLNLNEILKQYAFLNIIFYTIAIVFSVLYLLTLYTSEKLSFILKKIYCFLKKNKNKSTSVELGELKHVSKLEVIAQRKRKMFFKSETSEKKEKALIKKKEKKYLDKIAEIFAALMISMLLFIGFFNEEFSKAIVKQQLQSEKETMIMNEKNCIPVKDDNGDFKMNKTCILKSI